MAVGSSMSSSVWREGDPSMRGLLLRHPGEEGEVLKRFIFISIPKRKKPPQTLSLMRWTRIRKAFSVAMHGTDL